jgi:hypothetical protein
MEIPFGVIPPNDSHNRSFSRDLHLIIGQPGKNKKGYDYPAAPTRSKPENDSSGWLSRVRPAVSVQGTESEAEF